MQMFSEYVEARQVREMKARVDATACWFDWSAARIQFAVQAVTYCCALREQKE